MYTWTNEPVYPNSSLTRIASRSLPTAHASRPVSQDSLRKWERAACDQSYMCNQAAGLSRCLTKVQESMVTQLKVIQGDRSEGKFSSKLHQFLGKIGSPGGQPQSCISPQGRLHSPLRFQPNLTRSPTIISHYVNPHRNLYLVEALHQLLNKNAVELVSTQTSLGFYNRLFLVPKPNNWWRPILDLSILNKFLKTESFKMESLETVRTSLQTGEWVTCIDFKDAHFLIPIQSQFRKNMHFHIQGQSYQFKALPFGLSPAPMDFMVVVKEIKLLHYKRA